MSMIFQTLLSRKEKDLFFSKLVQHTVPSDHCHQWVGAVNKDGYGVIRLMFRNHRRRVTVHRLQHFISNDCGALPSQLHIYHLCHNKLCVHDRVCTMTLLIVFFNVFSTVFMFM